MLTIMYRLLRNELGSTTGERFTMDELRAEYAEAWRWMESLPAVTP
jgi:hypothetical protein